MKNTITMSFVAAAAITAFAFTTPTAKKEKAYQVDIKKTTANWLATKVTGKHNGSLNVASGKLISDGKNVTGGTIEFDMNSISVSDLTDKEWNDKLVGHLKSDDFFSTAKHSTTKFVISKVTLKSGNDYEITGNLTIKGITHEIKFPAMIKMDDRVIVTIAKITVDRTKFDIKYGSSSFFEGIGDKAISDTFELDVNLVATVDAV